MFPGHPLALLGYTYLVGLLALPLDPCNSWLKVLLDHTPNSVIYRR